MGSVLTNQQRLGNLREESDDNEGSMFKDEGAGR